MTQFSRYWSDCPYPRYLVSNRLESDFEGFTNILLGEDVSWSDNLMRALGQIKEDYILLFLEDLILRAPVDQDLLASSIAWATQRGVEHLRLNATERPDERLTASIGRIREGAMYRTSTVLTMWRRDVLLALLRPGESAWEFELVGSARSDVYSDFYSTYRNCFPVMNCVIKGKWRRAAVRALAAQGVVADLSRREQMTRAEEMRFWLGLLRSLVFKAAPMRYRRRLHSTFRPRPAIQKGGA
jgi:hypothetical protein